MSKSKHHFVPRFYLKEFQSQPKRIHVYNLARSTAIANVSLRDQCYQHRFYGETDERENALMDLERQMAPIIRTTSDHKTLPPPRSEARAWLFRFAVLQSLRTMATARRIHTSTGQMAEAVWGSAVEAHQKEISEFVLDDREAVAMALRQLPTMVRVASDLEMHLVCANGYQRFITSDNPVFKYNLYCEGTKGSGTLGWGQRGFHLFLPLSPTTLLMLYDARVYRVGTRASTVTAMVTDSDVELLNLMQAVGAAENLYFPDWEMVSTLKRLHQRAEAARTISGPKLLEYLDEKDENHTLIHQFEQMPHLRLQLSFFSVRRDARRVAFHARPHILRRPELYESGESLPDDPRTHRRYVRPDLHPTAKKKRS